MHGVGPGSLLGGRYLVQRRIGHHARYERWRAADQTLDRDVILLCFDADGPVASAALDAARRAAGVEEHRLVRVLDVGHDPTGVAFVVEEPLNGGESLTSSLADGGLPAEEARRILGETASALERARARGLHHGVLGPRSVFLMDDGSIKVRGLATESALVENDDVTADAATRADTVALVGLAYALLTARWPLDGSDSGLEAAPRVVGGVAAPSEIAAGIPSDLDLLVRSTLTDDRGPRTPGELAEQVAPWSATRVSAGLAVRDVRRLQGTRTEPLDRDRATGGVSRQPRRESGRGWGRGASFRAGSDKSEGGSGAGSHGSSTTRTAAGPLGVAGAAAAGAAAGAVGAESAGSGNGSGRSVLGVPFGSGRPASPNGDGPDPRTTKADSDPDSGEGSTDEDGQYGQYEEYERYEDDQYADDDGFADASRPSPVAGVVAAGGAMARRMGSALGAAGSGVGDRVGGLARGAADRAAERSANRAERRQTERYEDPGVFGENVRLSETLESTDEELEPALPLLPGAAQEPLDRDQSRLVLIVIAAFVVVAAALGFWGLPKLSGIGVSSGAEPPAVTKTVTASPSDTPSAAAPSSAAPTPSAQPIAIASMSQISQDGGVQASKTTDAATDGNPDTAWRSTKWYATPQYGGYTDSQVGLLLDLGQPTDVHAVDFTVRGPADVNVLVADTPKVDGATTVGTVSGKDGDASVAVADGGAVKGRYVILWFGTLGPDGEGHYRAQVAEVSVK